MMMCVWPDEKTEFRQQQFHDRPRLRMTTTTRRRSQASRWRPPWFRLPSIHGKVNRLTILGLATGALSMTAMVVNFDQSAQTYLSIVHHDDELVPALTDRAENLGEIQSRERRKRVRPPHHSRPIPYEMKIGQGNLTVDDSWNVVEGFHHALCGRHAKAAAEHFPKLYPQQLLLDSTARVIITNILSSAGIHLALKLSMECGVEGILGIDAMLPNTRRNRVDQVERYALLKRRIPVLHKLVVPYPGVLPRLDVERLETFRATHIVHLIPDYLQELEFPLYPLRDKMQSMEQLLDLIRNSAMSKPHLLYAGPNLLYENILAASYHALYQIDSTGLELPHLYGPWEQPGTWVWNVAQGIVKPDNGTSQSKQAPEEGASFLYVENAVDAIVAAMQFKKGLLTLQVTSNTTKGSLKKAFANKNVLKNTGSTELSPKHHWQDLIQWMPETSSIDGVRRVLSWHFAKVFPYGRGDYQRKLPTYVMENFHYQFPCASECSIPGSCTPSVYDHVARRSRKLTRGCRYVIYNVNLSANFETLPPAVNLSTNNSSNLCQVAFVSSASAIGRKRSPYQGWSLLKVPTDKSTITEAEYVLPKLSPGLLFDVTVAKAVFVDPASVKIPGAEGIVAFVRSIDAPSRGGKPMRIQRSGTTISRWDWVSDTPARFVMLFGHEDPRVYSTESLASRVKNIADRDGARSSTRLANQLQFYEHAAHLVQSTESRRLDELRPPYYKNFPFHFLRSNMIVHDLRVDQARLLRCEWYDEQVFWGVHNLEDVSLAYVLAKRRVRGQHGPDEKGWTPLVIPTEDEMEVGNRIKVFGRAELFLRVHPASLSELVAEDIANEDTESQGTESAVEVDEM